MRIALISDVTPVPLSAGPLVLFRHFQRLAGHDCLVIGGEIPEADPVERSWEVMRLPRRLRGLNRPMAIPVFEELRAVQIVRASEAPLRRFRPDVVVSVWAREFLLAADRVARARRVPLVLICHDDLEAQLPALRHVRGWARARFGRVYRRAATRLCASEGLRDRLHARHGVTAEVLPPIPGEALACAPAVARASGPLRVGFGGNAGGGNEAVLAAVARACRRSGAVLEVSGPPRDEARARLCRDGAVTDLGSFPSAAQALGHFAAQADVMLVVQSFRPDERDFVTANFPSKLAESARLGLPLLVVAPPGSSAARWGEAHANACVLVCDAADDAIARALDRLRNPGERATLARSLHELAATSFDPAAIHARLERALAQACAWSPGASDVAEDGAVVPRAVVRFP